MNITKFGAFVNILPGRDGLLHISKIGGGKRIDKVEDVLDLGDEVDVRVDDVDPSGKVSLSLATAPDSRGGGSDGGGSAGSSETPASAPSDSELVSFEDTFDAELRAELGDLGPARASVSAGVAVTAATGVAAATAATATEVVVAAGAASLLRFPEVPSHVTSAASTEEIRETRLANGIRVVTEHMPEARSVTLGVWVAVGGRDEPDELAGASHFLEHLLFKGTSTRTARQIAEAIDAVGGEMNAFTSREHTAYYTRLPAHRVELGLDILGDVLTDPAFRPTRSRPSGR